ncbi:MAG: NAD(P)/FAD-dependent oxidoreductase [Clostridiales bacterium]|nr:NAD(P)/FAD-dependent oxidoreductase [Clostridiales bacterium]
MDEIEVLVIGAGAAGLMAAGTSAELGKNTVVLERNERPARKVMITGKGRCNVTNNCNQINELVSNVPTNGRFLYGAFSRFMPSDTIDFFESRGVPLKCERGNRVFPVSDKAADIVDALKAFAFEKAGFIRGRAVRLLTDGEKVTGVLTDDGRVIKATKVIVCTGGMSYPATGSTGDGYELARGVGHTFIDPKPSLVPLECHEGFCSDLMGLSLRNVRVKVTDSKNENKEVYSEFGEMLFTHFGVSGPVILSASAHLRDMEKGRYIIHIDLKPALNEKQLDERIRRDFLEFSNKNFINSLNSLLPKKLVPVVVKLSKIPMNTKVNQVTAEQRLSLVKLLKDFQVTVTDFRPVEEAIVTSGGVETGEVNPSTMESKIINGLYFAGEVLNVDAYTGGFNLQIAFSTGALAGVSAAK